MNFTFNGNTPSIVTFNGNDIETVKCNGVIVWQKQHIEYNGLTFTAEQSNSTVKYNKSSVSTAEYSYDGTTWNNANGVTITLNNIGDKVYFRGVISGNQSDTNYAKFTLTGLVGASGSIMSMYNNNPDDTTISRNYTFKNLFRDCTSLTTAPELPATTLSTGCYNDLFNGCTSLVTGPAIPATYAPLNSCAALFYGCTSLTSVGRIDILEYDRTAATYLFYGCTSLTDGPVIYAKKVGYDAFGYLFMNCSNLHSITIYVDSWYNAPWHWTDNVASTGIYYNRGSGAAYIPTGWVLSQNVTIHYSSRYGNVKPDKIVTTPYTLTSEDLTPPTDIGEHEFGRWNKNVGDIITSNITITAIFNGEIEVLIVDSSHRAGFNLGNNTGSNISAFSFNGAGTYNSGGSIISASDGSDNNDWRIFYYGNGLYYDCGSYRIAGVGSDYSINKEINLKFTKNSVINLNTGSTIKTFTPHNPTGGNINLGVINSSEFDYCIIKNVKLYDSNNVVYADFVPFIDTNNRPCLKETISGTLYYSITSQDPDYM